ncbi:MAG TPA: hypothetical protein ENN65_04680 [Candidatus Hydrogenedentes bacterium]|nr:hypothetical protein [Candidatus Hydrogenedentota bacterium]
MTAKIGQAIGELAAAVARLRAAAAEYPTMAENLFAGADEWMRLLHYKLLPHLGGGGCLVIAVAGGTNTGKSTVFNMLLGGNVSPVRPTAAATCRPVVAANAHRARQCLDGLLLSGFRPLPLSDPDAPISHDTPPDALFVSQQDALPDRLVLMDIPDVDSIYPEHWELAENIQAAGDVLVAVVTPEKYKDERVVAFFKRARAAGRHVLPLMNKADPRGDFAAARAQLDDFRRSANLERRPAFVLPHDFNMAGDFHREIAALDGALPLRAYLDTLDAVSIKAEVYQDTIRHFSTQFGAFLYTLGDIAKQLRAVAADFEARADQCAEHYDPEPGEDVGRLVHAFVQSKRGPLRRAVGYVNDKIGQGMFSVWRRASAALRGRAENDGEKPARTADDLAEAQHLRVETLARTVAQEWVQAIPTLGEPARSLVSEEEGKLNIEAAVREVVAETTRNVELSQTFQEHARKTMEAWWNDHAVGRRVLMELDWILAASPLAVALTMGVLTGGFGVPEVAAMSGTFASTFFAKIMEHQFADHWIKFVQPWRDEQRGRFRRALRTHLADAFLAKVHASIAVLEGDIVETMRRCHEQCRKES